jgi:NTP pyrophosphatase (non-canonical NTP hydrolase)
MFTELRKANIARDKVWNPDNKLSLSFAGNELAGETGEACNIIKKLDREVLGLIGSRADPRALAEELADVIICVDLIAMRLGLDMAEAVKNKFNKTSEQRGLNVFL